MALIYQCNVGKFNFTAAEYVCIDNVDGNDGANTDYTDSDCHTFLIR